VSRRVFCGDYLHDGKLFSLMFLAHSWEEAGEVAARLKLANVGKLKGLLPATRNDVEWAQDRSVAH